VLAQHQGNAIALAHLPDGDLIAAGGMYVNGSPVGVYRFDGSTWTIVDGGITSGFAETVAASESGDLFAAGSTLAVAGGHPSARFAHAAPTCPAAVVAFGAGCAGGGGPMTLVAVDLPWAGGTFTATASGFPAHSLGVLAAGDQPLVAPLPLGGPGCSLFVQPLLLELLLPANGAATGALALPPSPALAGVQLRVQVVGAERDAAGNLLRLTATNALALTVGAL
jgi:hypothetical protein